MISSQFDFLHSDDNEPFEKTVIDSILRHVIYYMSNPHIEKNEKKATPVGRGNYNRSHLFTI